jgi:hypothetical protein
MAVNDVLGQLQLLLKKSTPLVESSAQPAEDFLKLTPGQQVTAKVLGALPSGRFLVLVDDRQLDLNLPRNTQPGASVDLRFVGNQPRPTFILAGEAGGSAGRAAVSLSDTARFIGALLEKANTLSAGQTSALTRSAPVLSEPPADTRRLAVALKSALSRSGLFYEAHQAQWVTGDRSLAELLKEPQAQLSEPRSFAAAGQRPPESGAQAAAGQAGDARHGSPPRSGPDTAAAPGAAPARPLAAEGAQPQTPRELTAAGPREPGAGEPVHMSTAPLVQQQLDALDTRQIVWQGQIWPGQTLHWEIEEREARESAPAPENEWQTRLALSLPNLGEVGAQLRISAQGIRVEVTAATPEAVARLQQEAESLHSGFARAELSLLQLTVKQDG